MKRTCTRSCTSTHAHACSNTTESNLQIREHECTRYGEDYKQISSQIEIPNMFRFQTFNGVTDMNKF